MKTICSYRHRLPEAEQPPDPQPGYYYVSVRDGARSGLLLGPFKNDHARALALVGCVRRSVEELDPRAVFWAFGTCRLPIDCEPPSGRLNYLMKEGIDAPR